MSSSSSKLLEIRVFSRVGSENGQGPCSVLGSDMEKYYKGLKKESLEAER